MALGGHELLLIVRAQNQASQALRRVAMDAQRLGSIRDMHLRQGQLAINQSQLLAQRQTRLNELSKIEGDQASRALGLNRRQLSNRAQILTQLNALQKSQMRYNKLASSGVTGPALVRAGRDVEAADKRLRSARVGMQQLSAEEINLANRASVLRQEIALTNQRLAQNVEHMNDLSKAIRVQRWDKLQTGARIVTHLGRIMQMAGLVGGAALGYLAHGAAQFNSQVTLVATQTGPIGSGFQRIASNAKILQNALLGVMKQGTATRDELTQAAYDIFSSLTIPGNNLQQLKTGVGILRQFNKAAVAGAVPINDVSNAVIAVLGAFKEIQPTGQNVEKLLQRMFAAVRFGRFTFADLTKVMGTAAPAARAAGQSFNTLMGSLAFLSRPLGINKAAIGFARLSEILTRQKMVKGLKDLGVNITDANGKLLQMPEIIGRIVHKFPELTKGGVALGQFFKKVSGTEGTIQARRAFVFAAQQLDRYRLVLGQATTDNNEFARSRAAMLKTAGVQWQIFLNNLKAFGLQIGEIVLPALVKLTKPLQELAHWFENLDQKQKETIGKYATYAAAILLFGGTVLAVGGMIVSFIAIMGKLGIAGPGIAVSILAVVAAVKVLQGDWNSLTDAISSGVDTMLGSFKGFVAMSALVVVAALRISKAFKGLAAMSLFSTTAGAGAGAGGAGVLRGTLAALSTGIIGAKVFRAEGAGRLTAGLRGAGVAAAALPGPLKIAAAAVGLAAGAAELWKLHMAGVEKHSERIQRFQQVSQAIAQAPAIQAQRFGGLGMDVRNVVAQRNAVDDLNASIKQNRKELAAASSANRPALQRQLTSLIIQRADAMDLLHAANRRANQSFNAFTGFLQKQVRLTTNIGDRQLEVNRMMKELSTIPAMIHGAQQPRATSLRDEIKLFRGSIRDMGKEAIVNGNKIRGMFFKVARQLHAIDLVPKLKPGAIDAMFRLSLRRRRALTIPEMRTVIKAVADPASLHKLPRDIQAAVRAARVTVRVNADRAKAQHDFKSFSKSALGRVIPAVKVRLQTPVAQAQRDGAKIARVFRKTIHQKIHIDTPQPDAFSVGAAIIQGMTAGVQANSPGLSASVAAAVNAAVSAGKTAAQTGSPSKKTYNEIGVPLMQGIIQGIISQFDNLGKTAQLAVDLFQGPWLTSDAFTNATKRRGKDIENLQRRIDKMKRSGETASKTYKRLLKELATSPHARGTRFQDLFKDLNMTVRMMMTFNRSLERLRRRGVPLSLLNQLASLGVEGAKYIKILANATDKQLRRYIALWNKAQKAVAKSMRYTNDDIAQAAQNLLDQFNQIKDGIQSAFLDITNIDEMGAPQRPMSSSRILRNAQRMVAQFQQFGDLLDNLIKRGLPLDMALQLAQMGPAALPILQGLNSMTSDQFNQFVSIWTTTQKKINDLTKTLMKDQIDDWKKHGKNIALGIISGVMSEQDDLLKFFRNLFKNLLKEARKETKSHSPSMVFELLGKDIVAGLALGLAGGNNMRVPMPGVGNGRGRTLTRNDQPQVHMTINAQHSESLMSTMERAAFRLRNRAV